MPTILPAVLLASLLAATTPAVDSNSTMDTEVSPPARPDLAALIQCQGDMERFRALHAPVEDPLAAIALGWSPLPRTNPFMAEYTLLQPLTLFEQSVDRFLISGGTVMAILDGERVSPQVLASKLALEVALDEPYKFMAGREVISRDRLDAASGMTIIESAVLGVSTVSSHPGKVLAGCTYSLDLPEEEDVEAAPRSDGSLDA